MNKVLTFIENHKAQISVAAKVAAIGAVGYCIFKVGYSTGANTYKPLVGSSTELHISPATSGEETKALLELISPNCNGGFVTRSLEMNKGGALKTIETLKEIFKEA